MELLHSEVAKGTPETIAACQGYVVGVLRAQAGSCWRSGAKLVFPKGLELGSAVAELACKPASELAAAALCCLAGAQEQLPVDLPGLLAAQGLPDPLSLPAADAFDGRNSGAVEITLTMLDVLTDDPADSDSPDESAAALPEGFVPQGAPQTEGAVQSSILGVLDQLAMAEPSLASGEKWERWMAQLQADIRAAAAIAFAAGSSSDTAGSAAAQGAHTVAADLARLLLHAPGWAATREPVLARCVGLLTEKGSGGGGGSGDMSNFSAKAVALRSYLLPSTLAYEPPCFPSAASNRTAVANRGTCGTAVCVWWCCRLRHTEEFGFSASIDSRAKLALAYAAREHFANV